MPVNGALQRAAPVAPWHETPEHVWRAKAAKAELLGAQPSVGEPGEQKPSEKYRIQATYKVILPLERAPGLHRSALQQLMTRARFSLP